MASTIVHGTCFRCGRVKNLRWNHALDRGECRGCRARRSPQETCTGCGKQRRVNARTGDGGALCVTCYARTRTAEDACDECGSIGPLATRIGDKPMDREISACAVTATPGGPAASAAGSNGSR